METAQGMNIAKQDTTAGSEAAALDLLRRENEELTAQLEDIA